jgi:hypothetical protein
MIYYLINLDKFSYNLKNESKKGVRLTGVTNDETNDFYPEEITVNETKSNHHNKYNRPTEVEYKEEEEEEEEEFKIENQLNENIKYDENNEDSFVQVPKKHSSRKANKHSKKKHDFDEERNKEGDYKNRTHSKENRSHIYNDDRNDEDNNDVYLPGKNREKHKKENGRRQNDDDFSEQESTRDHSRKPRHIKEKK